MHAVRLCVYVYELYAVCSCCAGEADGLRLPGRTPASRQQLGTAAQMNMINARIVKERGNEDDHEILLNFKVSGLKFKV